MPGIIWLASYPKSGNTWLRAFLANVILDQAKPLSINRIGEVCPSENNIVWYKPLTEQNIPDLKPAEIAALRGRAQRRAVSLNKHILPLKTHNCLAEYAGHPLISMELTAGALYIVRDPRDVAVSASHHWGFSIDNTIAVMAQEENLGLSMPGHTVFEYTSSWSTHVRSWTQRPHSSLVVLRYEDLLADPRGNFANVARRMGVTEDKKRIRRAVGNASFDRLRGQELRDGFGEQPKQADDRFFRSGKAGKWRDILTAAQAARIERDHGEQMKRFGYL